MLENTFWNFFIASGDPEVYVQYREYCNAREEQIKGGDHQDEGTDRGRSAHGRTGQTTDGSMRG